MLMQAAMYAKEVNSGSSRQATPLIAEALEVLQLSPQQVRAVSVGLLWDHRLANVDLAVLRTLLLRPPPWLQCPRNSPGSSVKSAKLTRCWQAS